MRFDNLRLRFAVLAILAAAIPISVAADPPPGEGWTSLFNGKNLSAWKYDQALHGDIWTIQDGVIDCFPRTGKSDDPTLWSKETYGDFELVLDWRIKETKGPNYAMPVVLPDGTHAKDADGNDIQIARPNADSGVYVRGSSKSQINIWCWPIGSGEVYGYRTDARMPADVRAGVTPIANADRPVGEWNTFRITVKGDRLTVELNGVKVLDEARLPGMPEEGPIALQHHGGYNAGSDTWNAASSLVQFRNLYIRPLD